MLDISITPILLGSIVGFVLALTGAGGAILSVPLLTFGMHLSIVQAAPIGLLAISISASIGAFLGFKEQILRYKAASLMASCGLILSPIGLLTAHKIPNGPLTIIFAVVLSYVALKMLWQSFQEMRGIEIPEKKLPPCILNQSIGKFTWTAPCAWSLALSGSLAGFFSGLLGVGGGFIIVPSLKKYTDLPINSIVVTSLGVLAIVCSGGVIAASLSGNMNWTIGSLFSLGALIGMLLGKQFSKKIAGPRLQQVFGVFALGIAMSMAYKVIA